MEEKKLNVFPLALALS